jgi:hypothetical protein
MPSRAPLTVTCAENALGARDSHDSGRLNCTPHNVSPPEARVPGRMEVHHASHVFDENVDARSSVKPVGGQARVFGTPAVSCNPLAVANDGGATTIAPVGRRALGDISNRTGAAGGAGLGAGKAGSTPWAQAAPVACQPAAPPSAICAGLPISERTAGFITHDLVALASRFAADGCEVLAGLSGREQAAQAQREAQERGAQAVHNLHAVGCQWSDEQVRGSTARTSTPYRCPPIAF